ADAAAALAATSSMNTAVCGTMRWRSHRIWKMRGWGLITPSMPETTMPSNHDRNAKRWRCGGNVCRPVRNRIDRHRSLLQLREHVDRPVDRAADHLVETLAKGLDQLDLVGMERQQFPRRL